MAITLDLTLWKILKYLILYILPLLISAGISSFILYKKFKKIDSTFEKSNFINRVQFEKEFNIYVEIWEKLSELDSQLNKIVANLYIYTSCVPDSKKKYQKQQIIEYIKILNKILIEYRIICKKYSPFYPEEIQNDCTKLLESLTKILNLGMNSFFAPKQFDTLLDHLDIKNFILITTKFSVEEKTLSNTITKRIENLKVID